MTPAVWLAAAIALAAPALRAEPAGEAAPPAGWWLQPVARAALRVDVVHETTRPYSTEVHPRDVAGSVALSCEDQEGRPCGQGQGIAAELDAAAGYAAWVTAAVRVRARTGRDGHATALDLDRAYVRAELGPIAAELGRDVLAIRPAAATRVGWSANPPPLDHLRLSGARPLALAGGVHGNLVYVLGRLAAPQTFRGNLISIARGELDLGDRVELGVMQLLQLGGDGAPGLGPWDFVLEHVRRRDASAGTSDSSNRRLGLDVAVRLDGVRVTYQVMFEDLRHEVWSAVRHDADHVVDVDTGWLTVELHKTGIRAYEHSPRVTGLTSGGRIVGDPLGPDAQAVLVAGRIPAPWGAVAPWAEVARFASDLYQYGTGPIVKIDDGTAELRFRIGVRARVALGRGLELAPDAALEDVERAAFVSGARRVNALFRAALIWRPPAGADMEVPR